MEVVLTAGAIRRAKLQSNHHHQRTNFLQAGCHSCHPANSVKELKEDSSLALSLTTFGYLRGMVAKRLVSPYVY